MLNILVLIPNLISELFNPPLLVKACRKPFLPNLSRKKVKMCANRQTISKDDDLIWTLTYQQFLLFLISLGCNCRIFRHIHTYTSTQETHKETITKCKTIVIDGFQWRLKYSVECFRKSLDFLEPRNFCVFFWWLYKGVVQMVTDFLTDQ